MARRTNTVRTRALAVQFLATLASTGATKYVLQTYSDPTCTSREENEGDQQSWTQIDGSSMCFEITHGTACPIPSIQQATCYIKLDCDYDTGSGVVAQTFGDSQCMGEVYSTSPLASQLTWLEVDGLFQGQCARRSAYEWMKFDYNVDRSFYPNCSSYGRVAPVGGSNQFETSIVLQVYTDATCTTEYEVTTSSINQVSRYRFDKYRGAQHCFDLVDVTPVSVNDTSRRQAYSVPNFRLACNVGDALGNGIMVERYNALPCAGRATAPEAWAGVFYPMNFPTVTRFFNGECVQYYSLYAKFERPWSVEDDEYPQCEEYSCTRGYCDGGPIQSNEYWGPFQGNIGTAQARASTSSSARAARAPAAPLAACALLLAGLLLRSHCSHGGCPATISSSDSAERRPRGRRPAGAG